MNREMLDRYGRMNSPVQRLSAAVKLFVALAFVSLTLLLPRESWTVYCVEAVALVGVARLSRIPGGFLLRKLLLVEPLVIGVALLSLWQPDGGIAFLNILVRSTLCLFCMILFGASTPFGEILRVLKRVHVPGLLVTTLALMYRYQFLLLEEADRMQRARRSRTFSAGRSRQWSALSTVVAQLFIRATDRATRIYAAMCARGWKI